MTNTRTPWSEKVYREVATPGYGYLEHQWGWSPQRQQSGRIVEIYRDGSYLFAPDDDPEWDEVIVEGEDPRDFEVDMPPDQD